MRKVALVILFSFLCVTSVFAEPINPTIPSNAIVVLADNKEIYESSIKSMLFSLRTFRKYTDKIYEQDAYLYEKNNRTNWVPSNIKILKEFNNAAAQTPFKKPIFMKKELFWDYGKEMNVEYVTSIILSRVTSGVVKGKDYDYEAVRYRLNINILDVKTGEYVYNASEVSDRGGYNYSFQNIMGFNSFPNLTAVRGVKKFFDERAKGLEIPFVEFPSPNPHSIIVFGDDEILQRIGRIKATEDLVTTKFASSNIFVSQKASSKPLPNAIFDLEEGLRTSLLKDLSSDKIIRFGKQTNVEQVTVLFLEETSYRLKGQKKSGEFVYSAIIKTVDIKTGEVLYEKTIVSDPFNDDEDAYNNLLTKLKQELIR